MHPFAAAAMLTLALVAVFSTLVAISGQQGCGVVPLLQGQAISSLAAVREPRLINEEAPFRTSSGLISIDLLMRNAAIKAAERDAWFEAKWVNVRRCLSVLSVSSNIYTPRRLAAPLSHRGKRCLQDSWASIPTVPVPLGLLVVA